MTDVRPTAAAPEPREGAPAVNIVIGGAAGRMGSRIVALHGEAPGLRVAAALEAPGHRAVGRDAGETAGVGKLGVPITADAGAALTRDRVLVGVYGRQGVPGERTGKEIGVMSLRSGDVVGEHTVSFGTLGERLELTHKAHSRDMFARGALRAVRWVAGRGPGLYSMHDVLGIA